MTARFTADGELVCPFDDERVASAEGWRIRRRVAGFVLQRDRAV